MITAIFQNSKRCYNVIQQSKTMTKLVTLFQ